jgi:hypothetical protein
LARLEANPQSNLYARQLPVTSIDSKWLEGLMMLIVDLVATLKADARRRRDLLSSFRLEAAS